MTRCFVTSPVFFKIAFLEQRGVSVMKFCVTGLTAMVKYDDHAMTWYDHGDSYSPWYDHGDSYSPWYDHGDSYSPCYDHS